MTETAGGDEAGVRQRMPYARRRRQLLAEALEEFGRRGYHDTQMEHVAAAARVSKALLYQHFASKEELFAEVTAAIVDEVTERLAAAVDPAAPSLERVRAMIHALFGYAEREPRAWSVVIRHLDSPELGVELRGLRERLGTAFADLLLIRRRADPALSPERLAATERKVRLLVPLMAGSLLSMVSWWLEHPELGRERAEAVSAEFIWLGLDRLRSGERLPARATGAEPPEPLDPHRESPDTASLDTASRDTGSRDTGSRDTGHGERGGS